MVTLNHEHDHGNGPVCPGCRFRAKLATFLEQSHSEGREEWHWAVGELRQHMHAALLALNAVEARPFMDGDDDDPDDDPAADAASAITAVASEIEQLWHVLMDDRQGDDDPGAAL